jgi:hypothetical protein
MTKPPRLINKVKEQACPGRCQRHLEIRSDGGAWCLECGRCAVKSADYDTEEDLNNSELGSVKTPAKPTMQYQDLKDEIQYRIRALFINERLLRDRLQNGVEL